MTKIEIAAEKDRLVAAAIAASVACAANKTPETMTQKCAAHNALGDFMVAHNLGKKGGCSGHWSRAGRRQAAERRALHSYRGR